MIRVVVEGLISQGWVINRINKIKENLGKVISKTPNKESTGFLCDDIRFWFLEGSSVGNKAIVVIRITFHYEEPCGYESILLRSRIADNFLRTISFWDGPKEVVVEVIPYDPSKEILILKDEK